MMQLANRFTCSAAIASVALCSVALPAQTFTVGGSGAAYPDIGTAVAAVPSGAVLDVRPGIYAPFTIDGKSITVLGGPGVDVSSLVAVARVQNLAQNQQVTLLGLRFCSAISNSRLFVASNQGRVVLDRLTADNLGVEIVMTASEDVRIRRCIAQPVGPAASIYATDSNLRISNSTLDGPGLPGSIWLENSSADLTDCIASSGVFASTVTLTNAHLTLRGACTLQSINFAAIDGSGSVRIDPQVSLVSGTAPPIAAGIAVTTRELPTVAATVAPPGQTTTATLRGPNTAYGWLFAGIPGLRIPIVLPTGADSDALDLIAGSQVLLADGALSSPLSGNYVSPSLPSLLGIRIAWQGLSIDGTNGLQISNSVTYAHR